MSWLQRPVYTRLGLQCPVHPARSPVSWLQCPVHTRLGLQRPGCSVLYTPGQVLDRFGILNRLGPPASKNGIPCIARRTCDVGWSRRLQPGPSSYVKQCILKVGQRAKVSAKSVADDAAALLADVRAGRLSDCEAVAALGGRDRSQCRRDYNHLLSKLDYGLEPILVKVTVQDPLKLDSFELELPMYAPHELVGAIYRGGWDLFSRVFFSGASAGLRAERSLEPENPIQR